MINIKFVQGVKDSSQCDVGTCGGTSFRAEHRPYHQATAQHRINRLLRTSPTRFSMKILLDHFSSYRVVLVYISPNLRTWISKLSVAHCWGINF